MTGTLPLAGLRVLEVGGGVPAALCARLLRGFGADTIRLEGLPGATGGLDADQEVFLVAGARRRSDPDGAGLRELAPGADVIVEDQGPGYLARSGLDPDRLRSERPGLVVTSISPFGHTGPRARWRATSAVQFAVGGLMSLTGEPHRPPLVTGGDQAWFFGGIQAFAATTVALLGRWRRGRGDSIDLSLQEMAASIPELYGAMSEYDTRAPVPRAGNSVRAVWGVYRCLDGFAGVCCLERQVPALFALLGEPVVGDGRFADPVSRAEHDDELLAHVMSFVSERTKDELVALGPIHRVPFGAVRTPLELLDDEAFAQRGFLDRVDTPWGRAAMPGRPFPGLGWAPPTLLEPPTTSVAWAAPGWAPPPAPPHGPDNPPAPPTERPLAGVRVLDLTMMWAGPYATKLLAEAGADVVKIESPRAWDNIRTLIGQDPAPADPWNSAYYFNEYNHSKRSLTLDLAQSEGRELFLRLVATADVVIENYRADVLDNLGLGYDVLRAANERIVVVSMAGFGKTGPLQAHVGFGPIIEMMSGLMALTGGIPVHHGNRHAQLAPQGCYPAAGDDAWVVVSVTSEPDWATVAQVIGRPDLAPLGLPERQARHDELDRALASWTAGRPADVAASVLQAAGVPAGAVVDTLALHDDPQLTARGFWRVVPNPKMHPYRQSGPTWRFLDAPPHPMRRSPWFGEHNDELLNELGLSPDEHRSLAQRHVIATAPINPSVG